MTQQRLARVASESSRTHAMHNSARILREAAAYQGKRSIVLRTTLSVVALNRRVEIWSLIDGEQMLLLITDNLYRYWTAIDSPLHAAKEQACDWLTEESTARRPR